MSVSFIKKFSPTIVPAIAATFLVGAANVSAATTTIWANGVSENGGWVDYNKDGKNDSQMCWAASSAAIIDWWQQKAVAAGLSLPSGAPESGKIFDVFKTTFGNVALGTNIGWEWYFSGYSTSTTTYSGGAYWKDYVNGLNIAPNGSLPGYISFGYAYDSHPNETNYSNFVSTIQTKFEEGAGVSLVIAPSGDNPVGHAITLWGIELDDGKLNRIFITDSDDGATALKSYYVSFSETTLTEGDGKDGEETIVWTQTKITLDDYVGGNNYYISSWSALSIAIPEPSAFGLLAGALALAFAAARRKRRPRTSFAR